MRILFKVSALVVFSAFLFDACTTDDYPPVEGGIRKRKETQMGETLLYECCGPGNSCIKKAQVLYDFSPSRMPEALRPYVESGNISGFFLNEEWQQFFPEFVPYPEVVAQIIRLNPKLRTTESGSVEFVKDLSLPSLGDNVVFTLKAGDPCKDDKESTIVAN